MHDYQSFRTLGLIDGHCVISEKSETAPAPQRYRFKLYGRTFYAEKFEQLPELLKTARTQIEKDANSMEIVTTEEALEARRAYYRKWNRLNADKKRQYNARYWQKKARTGSIDRTHGEGLTTADQTAETNA